jgi:hypothetical protein
MKRISAIKMLAPAFVLAAMGAGSALAAADTKDVVAIGAVELVEATAITVLGRSYNVQDTTGIQSGDKVAIHGTMQPDGSVVNAKVEALGTYNAGSDQIFETGVVTKVDEALGRLSVDGTDIDYTASLSGVAVGAPAVGEVVAVTGIQPTLGGVVIGSTTHADAVAFQLAYRGLAKVGISGGGAGTVGISGGGAGTVGISGGGAGTVGISGGGAGTVGISGGGAGTVGISGGGAGTVGISGGGAGTVGISGGGAGTVGISGGALSR